MQHIGEEYMELKRTEKTLNKRVNSLITRESNYSQNNNFLFLKTTTE